MPFTPSHAVVALPFIRTPLVPAAIAIGAMAPDLPLFLRGTGVGYGFTHSYANIVWTGILALGLLLIWRTLLRPAVPELMPAWIARRVPEQWSMSAIDALREIAGVGKSRWYPLWLALSLALGVASHILWDSFTHDGRSGVDLIPSLDEQWGPFTGFKWLQYGSGVLGLLIIAAWAVMRLLRATPRPVEHALPGGVRIAWWLSLPVILVTAWIIGSAAFGPFDEEFTVQHLAYRMLPPACAVWGALTVLLCLLLPVFRASHQRA